MALFEVELALFSYGGLSGPTFDRLLREVVVEAPRRGVRFLFDHHRTDALVSRARSIAATRFYRAEGESGSPQVLVMLDHDIEWRPGDLVELALEAHKTGTVLAGLYSCRQVGGGYASVFETPDAVVVPGSDVKYPALYLGAGFLAIPRRVLGEVLKAPQGDANLVVHECDDVGETFYDFFRPVTVRWPGATGNRTGRSPYVYLSEDWAFCERARAAGAKLTIWSKPILRHHGPYGFTVEDGEEKAPIAKAMGAL